MTCSASSLTSIPELTSEHLCGTFLSFLNALFTNKYSYKRRLSLRDETNYCLNRPTRLNYFSTFCCTSFRNNTPFSHHHVFAIEKLRSQSFSILISFPLSSFQDRLPPDLSFAHILCYLNSSVQGLLSPPVRECQIPNHLHWCDIWFEYLLIKGIPSFQYIVWFWFFSWFGRSLLVFWHLLITLTPDHSIALTNLTVYTLGRLESN